MNCTFNCKGKCIVIMDREDRMNDGKRVEYQTYADCVGECKEFKPYKTRLRDENK